MRLPHKTLGVAALLAITSLGSTTLPANAYCCALRASTPWNFRERSPEVALTLERQHRQDSLAEEQGHSTGLPNTQGMYVINSYSYAVGNWQQIEMTLGDGAEGLIMTENHQDNGGDAQAISAVLNKDTETIASGDAEAAHAWNWQ